MTLRDNFKNVLLLVLLGYLFFIAGNGILSLTNPDEVFYAGTAKEMMQQKTWITPYLFGQPQFEKPILTYWLLRLGFIMFGVSGFGARFFPALFAVIGVIAAYLFALISYKDSKKAFICALVLLSSGLYIGLARTVFTDMFFSIFILLSLLSFFWGYMRQERKPLGTVLFFVFSGLAVLTKGPLGFSICLGTLFLFLLFRRDLKFIANRYSLLGFLIFLAIAMPWYWAMIKQFGNSFTNEFFYNDHIRRVLEAEHRGNDTWFFYPVSMIACMMPWGIFVLAGFVYFYKQLREKPVHPVYLYLLSWILVVFLTFEFAHSKLTSYIFPMFAALAVITGDFIQSGIAGRKKIIRILSFVSWVMLAFVPIGLVVSASKFPQYISGSKTLLYGFIYLYIGILAVMFWLIRKGRQYAFLSLLAFQGPLFLFLAFLAHNNFEDYVSSKNASQYLLNNYSVEGKIICSKTIVRGVRFYTDKEVAVVNIGGGGFFSPHPIAYLNSDAKVREFLQKQPVTYGIISKTPYNDMNRILSGTKFKLELLKTLGDNYIIEIKSI